MSKYMGDIIAGLLVLVFTAGWFDTLWLFGVENSQHYTWWGLMVK